MSKEALQQAIDRIAAGTHTDQDLELYNNWCNAAQEQQSPMPADFPDRQQQMLQNIESRIKGKSYRKLIIWSGVAAAAAVLILYMSGGFFSVNISSKQPSMPYNILATEKGQQRHITLPDGTNVWLNAASHLKYPASFASTTERRVELTGEAYFEVAKDKEKPFIVQSRDQEVKVLGTHFNISSYSDDPLVQTTLLEGSVKVNNQITLEPGEQTLLDDAGKLTIRKADTAMAVSWKKGNLEFRNENIYGIMRKISRFHDIQVIYEGHIPMDGMNGNFALRQSIPEILEIIQTTSLLRCRQEGRKIYISKF
ncbi:DUF4974 domain-containing protein [Pseudoflavitalea sp. G-6-1-2]|uniref:FecR family protein n=1 Tax=Pseudoflavitalea sp. G-6-1-2 TaxID=2728841 RepID=UPI00146D50A8|nr:FecR family protein [Pseudoflavitalea sp. G-6-1-2]NML23536.1 DUF4974 domain-containing protein [Pseudoflavitalea sp. G-6-1-2]